MSRRTLGLGPLNLAGMLGRLGLGGASLPAPPLLQFLHNGFTAPDTLTTGALYVADNLGVLRTAGVNGLAIPGARLLVTEAEGATISAVEIINDGEFTSTANWNEAVNHSVTGGQLVLTNAAVGTNTTQAILSAIVGRRYKVVFTISGYVQGSVGVQVGLTGAGTYAGPFSSNGTHTAEVVCGSTLNVYINVAGTATLNIDSLSVREVIPKFDLTDAGGAALFSSTSRKTKSQGTVTDYSIDPDWQGMLAMPARTNKVTCRKINPTDTTNLTKSGDAAAVLSVVDDTAALLTAGLSAICTSGMVYQLDNSAGVADSIVTGAGSATNTNSHYVSVYVRGGDGIIKFHDNGAANQSFGVSATFQKISKVGVPSSGSLWQIRANAGSVIQFILPEFVESSFRTTSSVVPPPTVTDALASYTRAATVASFTSANRLRANDTGGRVHVLPSAAGQTGWLFNSYTGAAAEFGLLANPATIVLRNRNSSVDTDLTLSYTHVADREFEVDWLKLATGMHMRVREKISGTWQAWSDWEDLTSAGAQADATIAATYQYARNGANQFAASRPNFYTLFNATKAKLEAL